MDLRLSARPLDAAGWDAARDPAALVEYLSKPVGPRTPNPLQVHPGRRKVRHFAVACCRRVGHLVTAGPLTDLLDLVAAYAERRIGVEVLVAGEMAARAKYAPDLAELSRLREQVARGIGRESLLRATPPDRLAHGAFLKAAAGNSVDAVRCWEWAAEAAANAGADRDAETAAQATLLRDVFGNPFRPAAGIDPRWRTPDAVGLAAGIDAAGAFDRMPILADALEEAGCDNPDVLDHCRDGRPHARGCWVVDGVLGRSADR